MLGGEGDLVRGLRWQEQSRGQRPFGAANTRRLLPATRHGAGEQQGGPLQAGARWQRRMTQSSGAISHGAPPDPICPTWAAACALPDASACATAWAAAWAPEPVAVAWLPAIAADCCCSSRPSAHARMQAGPGRRQQRIARTDHACIHFTSLPVPDRTRRASVRRTADISSVWREMVGWEDQGAWRQKAPGNVNCGRLAEALKPGCGSGAATGSARTAPPHADA